MICCLVLPVEMQCFSYSVCACQVPRLHSERANLLNIGGLNSVPLEILQPVEPSRVLMSGDGGQDKAKAGRESRPMRKAAG